MGNFHVSNHRVNRVFRIRTSNDNSRANYVGRVNKFIRTTPRKFQTRVKKIHFRRSAIFQTPTYNFHRCKNIFGDDRPNRKSRTIRFIGSPRNLDNVSSRTIGCKARTTHMIPNGDRNILGTHKAFPIPHVRSSVGTRTLHRIGIPFRGILLGTIRLFHFPTLKHPIRMVRTHFPSNNRKGILHLPRGLIHPIYQNIVNVIQVSTRHAGGHTKGLTHPHHIYLPIVRPHPRHGRTIGTFPRNVLSMDFPTKLIRLDKDRVTIHIGGRNMESYNKASRIYKCLPTLGDTGTRRT